MCSKPRRTRPRVRPQSLGGVCESGRHVICLLKIVCRANQAAGSWARPMASRGMFFNLFIFKPDLGGRAASPMKGGARSICISAGLESRKQASEQANTRDQISPAHGGPEGRTGKQALPLLLKWPLVKGGLYCVKLESVLAVEGSIWLPSSCMAAPNLS